MEIIFNAILKLGKVDRRWIFLVIAVVVLIPLMYPLSNVLRDDVTGPTIEPQEVLTQAPDVADGQFRVPPILGESS